MSIYSTKAVTKDFAMQQLIAKIYSADNDELADLLFEAIGNETLNNFWVFNTQEEVDKYNEPREYI